MVFQGVYIIPSQTKIENLRHLHPALGFLSFRNSRPWCSFGWTKVVTIFDDHLSSLYDLSSTLIKIITYHNIL